MHDAQCTGSRILRLRHAFLALASLLLLSFALPSSGFAHLALIRMGPESASTLRSNDRTGSAVAAGDFNGDGYDDLAIGAPGRIVGPFGGAGGVAVVYGSKYGLTHVGGVLRTATSVGGASAMGANFGAALATGKFNSDAYDDLAIGVPLQRLGVLVNAGLVYVIHGGPDGLEATADTILSQKDGGEVIEAGDKFGAALVAGDFNGDGTDDLAVGSPGEDSNAGAVFQFPGSPDGITVVGAGFFKQADLPGGSNLSGDMFGFALAAGDLFGDAKEDLAVSAPNRAVLGQNHAGVVYLLPGTGAGLASAGSHAYTADDPDVVQLDGQFGYALAVGQFGAGAYRFLAIGEPGRDVSALPSGGRVVSVRGSAGGLDWTAAHYRILTQAGAGSGNPEPIRFGSALAAGNRWSIDTNTWGTDAYDELAVGTLHDLESRGLVQVLRGASTNVTGAEAENYTQTDLGDDAEVDDLLGASLAFGHFDDTGFANLAIGSPGEDTSDDLKYDDAEVDVEEYPDAGCVFINAPWRQVMNLKSRGTVVYNCNFDLVYSQRPFDRVRPASTTKIMTVLLASERMDPVNPAYVDPSTNYEVPFWVEEVGGSSANLYFCENMQFMDLARACISVSGNDAAYAIANLLEPQAPDRNVSDFVASMNAKVDAIGMPGTRFSNPAGRNAPEDPGVPAYLRDNYTTPVGLAILAREAMFNPIFREIVGGESWHMTRDVPDDLFLDCDDVTVRADLDWTYENTFLQGLHLRVPEGSGVKPGWTEWARNTRVLSAETDLGRVIVARFGIPLAASKGVEDAALLALGAGECDPPFVWNPPDFAYSQPYFQGDNVPTTQGHKQGGSAAYPGGESESTQVSVYHRGGAGPASLRLTVARSSDAVLLPQATAAFGASSFQEHEGLRLANPDTTVIPLRVTTTHPPRDTLITLQPHGSASLPATAATGGAQFILTVQNLGSNAADVDVEEKGYAYEITVGGTGSSSYTTLLQVDGPVHQQSLSVMSLGRDANPGNTVLLAAYAPEASPVSVESPRVGEGAWPISLLSPPWPNPSREGIHLLFGIGQPGIARLAIYDVRGRQIWARETKVRAPGLWHLEWNGDASLRRAPSGQYFFRTWLNEQPGQSGRLTLLDR